MDTFTYNAQNPVRAHGRNRQLWSGWLTCRKKADGRLHFEREVFPVAKIMDGIFHIHWNKPFTILTFETPSPARKCWKNTSQFIRAPGVPVKFTVTRDGATVYVQPTGQIRCLARSDGKG